VVLKAELVKKREIATAGSKLSSASASMSEAIADVKEQGALGMRR
jgi:hypothetical protein